MKSSPARTGLFVSAPARGGATPPSAKTVVAVKRAAQRPDHMSRAAIRRAVRKVAEERQNVGA